MEFDQTRGFNHEGWSDSDSDADSDSDSGSGATHTHIYIYWLQIVGL
jgi:hypothetical protein